MLWITITLLSFAFNVSTYIGTVATVYLLSLHGPRHDLDPLTSTVLRVPADSDVIDCALPRCTLSFSITTQLMVPRAGIEPARPFRKATDFKSVVSTYFTTEANCVITF